MGLHAALYRDRRLGDAELNARLCALDNLAAGKLKPPLPGEDRIEKTVWKSEARE